MHKRDLPTPELLRKLLRYEPDTGKLFWRVRDVSLFKDGSGGHKAEWSCARWNSCYAGKEAFTTTSIRGHKRGKIFNRKYSAHRVIWAMETGAWPIDEIDHKDHDGSNNRIINLRDVSCLENSKNQSIPSNNTSGFIGVGLRKRSQKWRARITVSGKRKELGSFDTLEDAINARKLANIEHGYHPNHGT